MLRRRRPLPIIVHAEAEPVINFWGDLNSIWSHYIHLFSQYAAGQKKVILMKYST